MKLKTAVLAAIITAALSLYACQRSQQGIVQDMQQELIYFQDTSTKICFAMFSSRNSNGLGLATVPCDMILEHQTKPPIQRIMYITPTSDPKLLWDPIGPV